MRRIWIAAACALALAGCVSVTEAPVGAYAVGTDYSVKLGHAWSDVSQIMTGRPKKVHLLSMDGPALNRLYLSEGLSPGDFLVMPAVKEHPTPTYKAEMSPTEEVEFVADSVSALDYQRVETSGLRPGKFGQNDALRFDIAAKTKEGLDMGGTALVAEKAGKLYVMLYLAPVEHYYAATLPEVERVFGSAGL